MNSLNKIKQFTQLLLQNIIAVLFVLGLIIINTASYLQFGLIIGLITTGLTLILIAIILAMEQSDKQ